MILASLLAALPLFASTSDVQSFAQPVDAVSVELPTQASTAQVRYKNALGEWSIWQDMFVESEQDPLTRESNLVMFDEPAMQIDIRGDVTSVHPITVSAAPVSYKVAATGNTQAPRILSREDWAADESLLYRSGEASEGSTGESSGDNGPVTSQRVKDCEQAQTDYPQEFKVQKTVRTQNGNDLRWAFQYSPSVKVIAVHHTAVKVDGDSRSGAERVRALYAYHANNRGWGDVGYHYLVDEDGKIYEGKAGGEYVVGGHAYCNNIGTVGVALLGNFEEEQPTQKQLKALQWLLTDIADTYDIDLGKNVKFHGKTMPPVVGHRDLVSTECPGFYLYGALDQIRKNAASGDVDAAVSLPKLPGTVSRERASARAVTRKPTVDSGVPRRVQRILDSQASNQLRRKIGSNAGKEVEAGTAARRAARLSGASSSRRSVRPVSRSSISRSSRPTTSKSSSSRSSRTSTPTRASSPDIRIHLSRQENGATSCDAYDLATLRTKYRGTVTCTEINGKATLINTLPLEDYMAGLAEEPDTEPYEKQRAFAIAARTYAAHYMQETYRKFPGMPYDGDDSPARFQMYGGIAFEEKNPRWVKAVRDTEGKVLKKDGKIIRPPYFSSDDGRTRTPKEAGWGNFPFAEIFTSKDDPWCAGMPMAGHGVGMSGCGAEGQANDGKTGEEILEYYYPGTTIESVR